MPTPVPAFFGMPGGVEVVVFLAIVLLLFGNRLPGAMRSLGRSVVEFKKGANDAENDDDDKSRDD
jgi:sec-independent protein translocase protein TatA